MDLVKREGIIELKRFFIQDFFHGCLKSKDLLRSLVLKGKKPMSTIKNPPILIHNFPPAVHEAFAKAQEYSEQIKIDLPLLDNIRSFIHRGSNSIRLSSLDSIPFFNQRSSASWSCFTPPPLLLMDPLYPFSPSFFSHKKEAKEKLTSFFQEENTPLTGDANRLRALFLEITKQEELCSLIYARMQGIQKS